MGTYIQGKDGKFAGSIGDGQSNVPTPAAVTPVTGPSPAHSPAPVASLADAVAALRGHGPLLSAEHPLLRALYAHANSVEELADRQARLNGDARVGKWDMDTDMNLAWSNGFAAGMREVLRALDAERPEEHLQYAVERANEAFTEQWDATLTHFRDTYNDAGQDLDAMLEDDDEDFYWAGPLPLTELDPDEQADIIAVLKGLSPADRDTLRVLLRDGWSGTLEDAVTAARTLNT